MNRIFIGCLFCVGIFFTQCQRSVDGISLNQSTYHALYRESSPTRKEKSGLTDTASLFRNEAFIQRFILQFRQDYLQGSSEESLYTSLIDFDQVRLFQEGESKEFGQKEYNRIKQVVDSERHYIEGKIDLIDVQLNFLDNYVFDELNMGCDNFVNAAFMYLLGRRPTKNELNEGLQMCYGQEGNIFFISGNSRRDLLEILSQNPTYFEYQAAFLAVHLYGRLASEEYISSHSLAMLKTNPRRLEDVIVYWLTNPPTAP